MADKKAPSTFGGDLPRLNQGRHFDPPIVVNFPSDDNLNEEIAFSVGDQDFSDFASVSYLATTAANDSNSAITATGTSTYKPLPISTTLETIMSETLGMNPAEMDIELLYLLNKVLKYVKIIFPWVNPRLNIRLIIKNNTFSGRVSLSRKLFLDITVCNIKNKKGQNFPQISIYLKDARKRITDHEMVDCIQGCQTDIIGCLSNMREHYRNLTHEDGLFSAFQTTTGLGIYCVLPLELLILPEGTIFYLNPCQSSIRLPQTYPLTDNKSEWRYVKEIEPIYRWIENQHIKLLKTDLYPALKTYLDWMPGDKNNPMEPK